MAGGAAGIGAAGAAASAAGSASADAKSQEGFQAALAEFRNATRESSLEKAREQTLDAQSRDNTAAANFLARQHTG